MVKTALAWIFKDETVTSVLIGASKPEQILDNLGAVKNTAFTKDELDKVDEISLN